jgi:hypothetical protein
MARRPQPTVVRHRTTIVGETRIQEAHEKLLSELPWSAVANAEASLQNRYAELQEEMKQMRLSLELPLAYDFQDSIKTRIEVLENTPIEIVLSKKAEFIDGEFCLHAADIWSEMFFIARHVDDDICWRSIHIIDRWFEITPFFPFIRTHNAVLSCLFAFNKDSLSHFQNWPVPPPLLDRLSSSTQFRFMKLLTKGCFAGITQHISTLRSLGGGTKWIELKKRLTNVLASYGKLLRTYLEELKSSFVNCMTSLESTLNFQRVPSQSYSDSIDVYLMAITLKHLINCFICLFLLQREKIRNRILVDVT